MRKRSIRTLEQCMNIFDWFGDERYEYIFHVWISKLDADERLAHALPELIREAAALVKAHRGMEDAYPEDMLTPPAA